MDVNQMIAGRDSNGNILLDGTERGNLTIHSYNVVPNNYSQLCAMIESNTVTIRLQNASAFEEREQFNIQFDVSLDDEQDTYVLTDGGWFPLMVLPKNTLVLADRNVISAMQYRYFLGKKKKNAEPDYFDSIFLSHSDMEFDVTLFALEGNQKQPPTPLVIDQQYHIAKEIMRHALPHIKLAIFRGGSNYCHTLSDTLRPQMLQRMEFLHEIAPKINREITSKIRKDLAEKVFNSAKKHKLRANDLAVILVFLRITMEGKKTAATEVIKESQIYSLDDAFNTAADLMALEILLNYIHLPELKKNGMQVAYITKDKGIAKIGALILNQIHCHSGGGTRTLTTTFPFNIFSDDDETQQLVNEYLQ